MKLLHTADWHLGKRLDKFSRHEEQKAVLTEICEIADRENVNAVLIAGDLFDTFNPPTEAVDLFYKTLKRLAKDGQRAVIAIAGNHDSPDRIEAPDPLARECGIIFAGYPNTKVAPFELDTDLAVTQSAEGFIELRLPGVKDPLRLLLTPYANEYRLKTYLGSNDPEQKLREILTEKWAGLAATYCDASGVNILLAHFFMNLEGSDFSAEPEGEKPILHVGGAQEIYTKNVPPQIQYVALGHLHENQIMDDQPCPMVYSGSPLAFSFSEADRDKFVVLIEAEPYKPVNQREIKLTKGRRLFRQRFEAIADAKQWLQANPDTLVELTIVTESYLTAPERKQLLDANDGIVTIIPEIKNADLLADSSTKSVDLSKNIEALFVDYFETRHGQKPNQRLLDLFREVLAEETQ